MGFYPACTYHDCLFGNIRETGRAALRRGCPLPHYGICRPTSMAVFFPVAHRSEQLLNRQCQPYLKGVHAAAYHPCQQDSGQPDRFHHIFFHSDTADGLLPVRSFRQDNTAARISCYQLLCGLRYKFVFMLVKCQIQGFPIYRSLYSPVRFICFPRGIYKQHSCRKVAAVAASLFFKPHGRRHRRFQVGYTGRGCATLHARLHYLHGFNSRHFHGRPVLLPAYGKNIRRLHLNCPLFPLP